MFPARPENIQKLTEAGLDETLENLHLPSPLLMRLLRRAVAAPARKFAVITDEYDQCIAVHGIQPATDWFVRHFVSGLRVEGQENIPREGPLLIVANHAGGIDFLAVMASITRPDLRMVANVHRVLQGVTHAAPHMLFTDNRPEARLSVMISMVDALRSGDAVLIFPSGLLEPDPALIPGAQEYMRRSWSPSLGVFLSKVPEARLLPVLVGGVVSPRAYNSLPARLRRTTKVRQKTALLMQYMAYMNLSQRWPAEVRVVIGSPCTLDELNPLGEPRQWLDAIIQKEQSLMAHHYPQSDRPLVNWDR